MLLGKTGRKIHDKETGGGGKLEDTKTAVMEYISRWNVWKEQKRGRRAGIETCWWSKEANQSDEQEGSI